MTVEAVAKPGRAVAPLFKKDIGYRKVFAALASRGIGMTREELLKKRGSPETLFRTGAIT